MQSIEQTVQNEQTDQREQITSLDGVVSNEITELKTDEQEPTRFITITDNKGVQYGPIDAKWLNIAEFFKTMLEFDKTTETVPLDYDHCDHFKNVYDYFMTCKGQEPKLVITKPLTTKNPAIMYPDVFTRNWLMSIKKCSKLCDLIKLVNFLHIPVLLDNACARLSVELQGETKEVVADIVTDKIDFRY